MRYMRVLTIETKEKINIMSKQEALRSEYQKEVERIEDHYTQLKKVEQRSHEEKIKKLEAMKAGDIAAMREEYGFADSVKLPNPPGESLT